MERKTIETKAMSDARTSLRAALKTLRAVKAQLGGVVDDLAGAAGVSGMPAEVQDYEPQPPEGQFGEVLSDALAAHLDPLITLLAWEIRPDRPADVLDEIAKAERRRRRWAAQERDDE